MQIICQNTGIMDKNSDKDIIALNGFDDIDQKLINEAITLHVPEANIAFNIENAPIQVTKNIKNRVFGRIIDKIEQKTLTKTKKEPITYKKYSINPTKMAFSINKTSITLNEREFNILYALIESGDEGCSRDYLLDSIWGYRSDLETHVVETQIYRLRQHIEQKTGLTDIISTIDGGYRLK